MRQRGRVLGVALALLVPAGAALSCSSDPDGASDGGVLSSDCPPGSPCGPPKTCGVGFDRLCGDGEACAEDADCPTDYCSANACGAPPANVHGDGRRNGGETGVDCGGTATDKPCGGGQKCKTSADCVSTCNAQGVCDAPGPTDGKKNDGETDVDCGGPNAPKCAVGKACTGNDDCALLACTSLKCVEPTSTDGVQNGGESDVDCGGPGVSAGTFSYTPPRCKDLQTCAVDADCTDGSACSPGTKRCGPRSCATAETAGITTCGAGEVGAAGATHETCCKSLKLPTRDRRLDKYEVTAGRFRAFVTAVGPDIRKFVTDYRAANPASQLAQLPAGAVALYPASLKGQLGLASHMGIDIDNYGGVRGCWNGPGDYGHNTYWQDVNALSEVGITTPRPLPREATDAKSLNCAMPIMFMAFCAWDGGELALEADYKDAWGAAAYPWGATPVPQTATSPARPNSTSYNWCNGYDGTGGFHCQNTALGDSGLFYLFPTGTNLANDMSPQIAAPGRFPLDATALKAGGEPWQDVFANLIEYTGDLVGTGQAFCDFTVDGGAGGCTRAGKPGQTGVLTTGLPGVHVIGRSWEGHVYDKAFTTAFPVTFQYGKFGGRCARPAQ